MMTPEQSAAYINAQVALLNCEVAGMVAENQHRLSCGESVAYGKDEFDGVKAEYESSLSHNAIMSLFSR